MQVEPLGFGGRLFDTVSRLSDRLLSYAIALAAIGVLSMALVELYKKLTDSKTRFHAERFADWMRQLVGDGADYQPALAHFVRLCTGVSKADAAMAATKLYRGKEPRFFNTFLMKQQYAVFALDTPQMMAAVQEAADVALANPQPYQELFDILVVGAETADVELWRNSRMAPVRKSPHSEIPQPVPLPPTPKEIAEAFARIRTIVVRKIDGFQIYTQARWASWNQLCANIVGAVIMSVALWRMNSDGLANVSPWLFLALSLLGGILAPLAKDLVSALRKVKQV